MKNGSRISPTNFGYFMLAILKYRLRCINLSIHNTNHISIYSSSTWLQLHPWLPSCWHFPVQELEPEAWMAEDADQALINITILRFMIWNESGINFCLHRITFFLMFIMKTYFSFLF